ncbi:Uncharacterized damage-inducible protein DinB (forms a four-helix bundle) [Dyadobacter sp. SG02]|uniref:DinB family protein n=1 Tax=Dyadobacter sp. SG02 TaxID=1855291 RepID=UPI0008BC58F6|nr:DinB family protein [Dyadobacter sp. SG02]SEI53801.1 Uncharacterized damage-inducible protein DinB (forms a four-helix bundle) [Dyadobacter sp. SG02]
MKEYLIRFFTFNNWANKAVADFISTHEIKDEQVLLLASHLAHAQRNWYFRVIGQQNDVPIWTPLPPSSIASQLAENGELWLSHLNMMQEPDFHTKLAYKNMAGDPYLDNLGDVLTHLVNHSTYHRGQIIYLLRGLGVTPPGTDFILFARQSP